MAQDQHHATLGVVSLGLVLVIGVISAVSVFLLGVMAAAFGWGVPIAVALSSLYIGYGPTFVGAIAGVMITWLYNRFLLRRKRAAA